jgi:hypothetical protein
MLSPVTRVAMDRPAAEAVSKQWWALLLAGIFSAIVGIVILSVQWTLADLAAVVSIFFVVNGAFRAATPPVDNSGHGWNICNDVATTSQDTPVRRSDAPTCDRSQVVDEPVLGEGGNRLQGASLFEEVGGTGHDREMVFAAQLSRRSTV